MTEPFIALDFETADHGRDSACQVGIVRVEGGRVVCQTTAYIRPPRAEFVFSDLHGITWDKVRRKPPFAVVWRCLEPVLDGVRIAVAHNAAFDREVLRSSCVVAGLVPPLLTWRCTLELSRKRWGYGRGVKNDLASVCERLDIPLDHHHAGSDALAAARVYLALTESPAATPVTEAAEPEFDLVTGLPKHGPLAGPRR